jgi:hypothetical protein
MLKMVEYKVNITGLNVYVWVPVNILRGVVRTFLLLGGLSKILGVACWGDSFFLCPVSFN